MMDSSLAMPKTMKENMFLNQINTNLTRAGDAVHADLWIGGSARDTDHQNTWTWVDGTLIDRRSGDTSLISSQVIYK